MGFYQFKRIQQFNQPKDELWSFISNPHNLKKITPPNMGFNVITKDLDNQMYEGMIIAYKVAPLFGIKTTWVTEITKVNFGNYFIDEQRIGPYKMWHHEHFLQENEHGTLMIDIVSYKPPFGILGSIANKLIIERKLEEIFTFRQKALNEYFNCI